ncbi:MAG: lysophospholipid acyltransferase family protein [Planctomycetota bacterium]
MPPDVEPEPDAEPPGMRELRISYADTVTSAWRRAVIRLVERVLGIRYVERALAQRRQHLEAGVDEWSTALRLFNLRYQAEGYPIDRLPNDRPLIFVANHPFGLPDGIVASHIASQVRDRFGLLAVGIISEIPEIAPWILPVDFSATQEAKEVNLKSRAEAVRLLKSGGVVVIFPAGEVATAPGVFGEAVEGEWSSFVGRLILCSDADVAPLRFEGRNSWAFHLVSKFSETVRLAMLIRETKRMAGKTIRVTVGRPIPNSELRALGPRQKIVDSLRERTLSLDAADNQLREPAEPQLA